MFSRNVLFIDDDEKIKKIYLKRYERIAKEIKESGEYADYDLHFYYSNSIENAKKKLIDDQLIVDVIVVDYQFMDSVNYLNGINLIQFIRERINKRCKIIFYTMNGMNIDHNELISLINNDIYRLLDKAKTEDNDLIRTIYEAVYNGDVLVSTLERFWNDYGEALDQGEYEILGEKMQFKEIIEHIRLDDKIGRVFVDKFMHKALLEAVSF